MSLQFGRAVRVSLALALAVSPLALAAQQSQSQSDAPQTTPAAPPLDELADHLRTLARNPHDLDALIGAGQSALSIGDATAALSFFGRANDEAPNDGRVKAGLGSTLLLLERPDDALRLFGEAAALGIPQSKIAIDRGLAYDLRGDQSSAQRDYKLAMRDGQSDELVRRYALSLGISGQKNEALNLLDPLLRKQDQAAWRDRTFILAMDGDLRGANSITRSIMPQQADAMEPFLRRLGSFTPAQRARAVTYGTMPEDARTTVAIPSSVIAPTRVAVAAPPPSPYPSARYETRPTLPVVASPPAPPKPSYRSEPEPSVDQMSETAAPADGQGDEQQAPPRKSKSRVVTAQTVPPVSLLPSPQQATRRPNPQQERDYIVPSAPPAVMSAVAVAPPAPTTSASVPPVSATAPTSQPFGRSGPLQPQTQQQVATPTQLAHPQPVIVTAQPRFAIASLLDDVKPESVTPAAHVPTDAELRASRIAAKKKAEAKAKTDAEAKAARAEEEAKRDAARRNPAREWVQVAGGNNRAGFARTYSKLKAAHAALFDGRMAYYTPLNRTYRILVGPFDDASDARAYVNQLTKAGLTGFTFSSEPGQQVFKVGTKGKPNGDTAEEPVAPKISGKRHHGKAADTADEPTPVSKHRRGRHNSDAGDTSSKSSREPSSSDTTPKRRHHRR